MQHKNIILVSALVLLDQLSKFFSQGIQKDILPFFSISSIQNTGALFGMFKGANILLGIVTVLVIIIILKYYKEEKDLQAGFNLILAGALGNLLDRIFRGHVLDFLNFKIWPVFNLADVFLTLGVIYCLYKTLKK